MPGPVRRATSRGLRRLGGAWHRLRAGRVAEPLYRAATRVDPGNIVAVRRYAEARERRRDPQGAIDVYSAAIMDGGLSDGVRADCLRRRAALWAGRQRWTEAATDYRASLHADPSRVEVMRLLVEALERSGDVRGAIDVALRARAHFPASTRITRWLAGAYADVGEWDTSIDLWRRLADADASDLALRCGLATAASRAAESPFTWRDGCYRRATNDDRDRWRAIAVGALERVVAQGPSRVRDVFRLGRLHEDAGRLVDAEDCYARALDGLRQIDAAWTHRSGLAWRFRLEYVRHRLGADTDGADPRLDRTVYDEPPAEETTGRSGVSIGDGSLGRRRVVASGLAERNGAPNDSSGPDESDRGDSLNAGNADATSGIDESTMDNVAGRRSGSSSERATDGDATERVADKPSAKTIDRSDEDEPFRAVGAFRASVTDFGLSIEGTILPGAAGEIVVDCDGIPLATLPVDAVRPLRGFGWTVLHPVVELFGASTRLTARAGGEPLVNWRGGPGVTIAVPGGAGKLTGLLAEGYTVNKKGRLSPPGSGDGDRAAGWLAAYVTARDVARERLGRDLFLMYGTLLGAWRDGRLIVGDDDFDVGFRCRQTDPSRMRAEVMDVMAEFVDAGFDVRVAIDGRPFHLGVDGVGIDVNPVWFYKGRCWSFAAHDLDPEDIEPTRRGTVDGVDVVLPRRPDNVLSDTYGPDWRTPTSAFRYFRSPEDLRILRRMRLTGSEVDSMRRRAADIAAANPAAGRFLGHADPEHPSFS